MGNSINLFENIEVLEPKCPRCDTKIILGVTTKYNQKYKCHVCLKCKSRLL